MSGFARILIADDQRDVIEALRLLLKSEAYEIDTPRNRRVDVYEVTL